MNESQSRSEPRDDAQRLEGGGKSAHIALAVAPDHVVVARLSRHGRALRIAGVMRCPLQPISGGAWPALEEALRELASDLGVPGGTADIALLRRLAHTKVIPLPPVRASQLPALVRRSARRHFAVRDEALVADGSRLPGPRTADALVPTLAACAPAQVVEAVAQACAAAGFRVGRIVSAPVALAEAVCARLPRARRGRVAALTMAAGADLVLLDDGVPLRVQPVSATDAADVEAVLERVLDALREAEHEDKPLDAVVVCGAPDEAGVLRDRLHADGTYGTRLIWAPELEHFPAEAIVALGAALARSSAPLLLPPALVAARARAARRRTVVMAAASLLFLIGSAGLHLWGLRREVDAVLARRAAIASSVARAREMRGSVEGVRERLQAIAALEREPAGWTEKIAALAAALPDSAHLRTLAADSTGLRLAGMAPSASAVVPALEAHPLFQRVSLAAPVRFEQGDAGERFDVVAQVRGGQK
jgi:Tfp pilus assembly protein PilN